MLSFISLNARGLKNNVKRKAIFLFCKEQKANCVFLQETHSAEADTKFWKVQWGDNIFFSHGTSHSAGVMILFNRLPGNIIDHRSDTNGHWLMVVTDVNGTNYILVCVYGYNRKIKNNNFLSILCQKLEEWKLLYMTDKIIIGGDFNVVPDEWLDRLPLRGHCHNFNDSIIHLASKLNLTDVWRINNPSKSQYTWFNSSNNVF